MREQTPREILMTNYYELEEGSLDRLVSQGGLIKTEAVNGSLYSVPLDTAPLNVAAVVNGMVIREGDEVCLFRPVKFEKPLEATAVVSKFSVNNQGQIEFKHASDQIPEGLNIGDVKFNLSAETRAVHLSFKGNPSSK